MNRGDYRLKARRFGIDTHQEHVVYMRQDCHVCRAEGFSAQARIKITMGDRSILATLNSVEGERLAHDEFGLSESAWRALAASDGELASFSHAPPVASMSAVRAKIYGHPLNRSQFNDIIADVCAGRYTDVEISAFLTACTGERMSREEVAHLTGAMVDAGKQLHWPPGIIVDKHCVGGLPGNRTTPLIVAIVTCHGLLMPKTSSRAITSPAGTADTMETLAPVRLSLAEMRRVVEREGGCAVWGSAVDLSPADDILIRVERALDIDSESQLVASVLSKKAAAGSTHVLIDIPVGPTAKVRSREDAERLAQLLQWTGEQIGLSVRAVFTDGSQPVGRGIGPALEARDLLAVLQNSADQPRDLRERAVFLAGEILELAGSAASGSGGAAAEETLASGRAWEKFQRICAAQGGMRTPPVAKLRQEVRSTKAGRVAAIDNRRLARAAKLAGAPASPASGLLLHCALGDRLEKDQVLFELHAETPGELDYALSYVRDNSDIFQVET
ncbi:thymidine phosphorylase family protein [Microbulbifer magnicolonia]|uniref:thymidine phosphorylase family protein n=1 Tax=Microbulbifer magnicolonia TaxID=3109744 RepID=UPI002B41138B|nr:thymidine phosphorylase family protein [Microbulbifer sp. GG15]